MEKFQVKELIDPTYVAWLYVRRQSDSSLLCPGPYDIYPTTSLCRCGCRGRYARASWFREYKDKSIPTLIWKKDDEAIATTIEVVNGAIHRGEYDRNSIHLEGFREGSKLSISLRGFEISLFSTRMEYKRKIELDTPLSV